MRLSLRVELEVSLGTPIPKGGAWAPVSLQRGDLLFLAVGLFDLLRPHQPTHTHVESLKILHAWLRPEVPAKTSACPLRITKNLVKVAL